MKDAARRQKIVTKFENAMRRAIANGLSIEKVVLAAEKVREARLSLFKGQREIAQYIQDPSESELNHLSRLSEREQAWQSKSVNEIVAKYQ